MHATQRHSSSCKSRRRCDKFWSNMSFVKEIPFVSFFQDQKIWRLIPMQPSVASSWTTCNFVTCMLQTLFCKLCTALGSLVSGKQLLLLEMEELELLLLLQQSQQPQKPSMPFQPLPPCVCAALMTRYTLQPPACQSIVVLVVVCDA